MVCPVCQHKERRPGDWCRCCGAYLGLLRHQPRRVVYCVCASIALGMILFLALAWQTFGPLLRGWPTAGPDPWFWWGFALGTFFLAFGLTARHYLASTWRKLLRPSRR